MTAPARKRVVVAEDAALLREAVVALLSEAGFEVVGAYGDAGELLADLERLQPDAVVLDMRMPPTRTDEGLRAAREIRCRWPSTGVVVLASHLEVGLVEKLLDGGPAGVGFLLKDGITDTLGFVGVVRAVASGGSWIDPRLIAQLAALGKSSSRRRSPLPPGT